MELQERFLNNSLFCQINLCLHIYISDFTNAISFSNASSTLMSIQFFFDLTTSFINEEFVKTLSILRTISIISFTGNDLSSYMYFFIYCSNFSLSFSCDKGSSLALQERRSRHIITTMPISTAVWVFTTSQLFSCTERLRQRKWKQKNSCKPLVLVHSCSLFIYLIVNYCFSFSSLTSSTENPEHIAISSSDSLPSFIHLIAVSLFSSTLASLHNSSTALHIAAISTPFRSAHNKGHPGPFVPLLIFFIISGLICQHLIVHILRINTCKIMHEKA